MYLGIIYLFIYFIFFFFSSKYVELVNSFLRVTSVLISVYNIFDANLLLCTNSNILYVFLLLSGVILELSEREKFCDNFRKKFWSKFWISLYILYIFTSPSALDREKSVSIGRLFLPNRLLG